MHLVVISSYEPRGSSGTAALLRELRASRGGALPFDICLVTNSDRVAGDRLWSEDGVWKILRRNEGMNIGAWDCAWRALGDYEGYLFLQDECRVVRDGWLDAFAAAAAAPGTGLVGETLNPKWAKSWRELLVSPLNGPAVDHYVDGVPARRVECYLSFLERHGVDPGADASHLRSLVWYLRREVLERIGGFPSGRNRGECIAAEIAVSRRVVQAGLAFRQVAPQAFHYFRHEEWLRDGSGKIVPSPARAPSIWARVAALARRLRFGVR